MKKLLGIVVLSLLFSNLGFAYEKYKPLSKINLKLWGSIEDLYQSMKILIQNKPKYESFSSESLIFAKQFLKEKKIDEYLDIV